MKNLNPTLWRTCRMLAGSTRVRLVRELHDRPGQSVGQLANSVGIGESDASQELRRIQSRGLLKSERLGARVIYRLEPDPQVTSAAPLLKALIRTMDLHPPQRDETIGRIAAGLAWPRRVAIAQSLMASPKTATELVVDLGWSSFAVFNHAGLMRKAGWIRSVEGRMHLTVPEHPLADALARLLKSI
jgi:DNA-binding transcriptional ArsR family regulator